MIFRLLAFPMRLVRWLYVQLGRVIETEEVTAQRRAVAEALRRETAAQEAAEQLKRAIRYTKARRLWGLDVALDTAGVENPFRGLCPICLQTVTSAHREWLVGMREADAAAVVSQAEARIAERLAAEAALAAALEAQAGAPTIQEMLSEAREASDLANRPEQKALMGGVAEVQAELDNAVRGVRAVAEKTAFTTQAVVAGM